MATWGGRCPACGQVFSGLRDGKTMGTHRTEYYYPFSNRREVCVYSKATREDAARGIKPLMRKTAERIRAMPEATRPPHDVEYLKRFEEKEARLTR